MGFLKQQISEGQQPDKGRIFSVGTLEFEFCEYLTYKAMKIDSDPSLKKLLFATFLGGCMAVDKLKPSAPLRRARCC